MAKAKKNTQNELPELPMLEHLNELRHRIIISFIFFLLSFVFCYSFKNEIYNIITSPLVDVLSARHMQSNFIYTKVIEDFTSTISLVISASLFISIPFWIVQIWLFIVPALYEKEQKTALLFFIAIPIFFLFGVIFCYLFVLPSVFDFFISFGGGRSAAPILQAKIGDYIETAISLLHTFGFAFLSPIILIFLNRTGILSKDKLISIRKYMIVFIFILAAILTPPDIISQIILAIPLLIMYEIAVFLSKNYNK